jgi:hypothetical protein
MTIQKSNIKAKFEELKEEILKDLIAEIKLPIKDLKMKSNTQFEFTIGQNSIIILNFEYKNHQFHWKQNLGSINEKLRKISGDYFFENLDIFEEKINNLGLSITAHNTKSGEKNIVYIDGYTAISYCFDGTDWNVEKRV